MIRRPPITFMLFGHACLLLYVTATTSAKQPISESAGAGPLVVVGGGGTPDVVLTKMLELAGGETARTVILPQASSRSDRGQSAAQMFRERGVKQVDVVEFDDVTAARHLIEAADLIWFPGGQQKRLIDALTEAKLAETVRQKHQSGAVIGGTSAGAAVMSKVMIPSSPKEQGLQHGNTPIVSGLGLCPTLVIDQHFVERQRFGRLLSAVIDHPQIIGVGISERTAIVVRQNKFVVMGEGSVVVLDARRAELTRVAEGAPQSARKLRVDVLAAGDRFNLELTATR
jgi:cyanophycinase